MNKTELVKEVDKGLCELRTQISQRSCKLFTLIGHLDEEKENGDDAVKTSKKDAPFSIPVEEVANSIYKELWGIYKNEANFDAMKCRINSLVTTIAESESKNYKFSTIKSRRKSIELHLKTLASQESIPMRQDMTDLVNVFYSQLLRCQKSESNKLNKQYKIKVGGNNRNKKNVVISGLVADCLATLKKLENGGNPKWVKVSIALALGTGRRMVEIHYSGEFSVTGEYEIFFSGQAKIRDAEGAKTAYSIPTLFPAKLLKQAHDYLKSCGRTLSKEVQKKDPCAVNKKYAVQLCNAMKKYSLPYKALRALYAECQWFLFDNKECTEKYIKFSDWLGYKDGNGDTTFMSYMVYRITDFEEALSQI